MFKQNFGGGKPDSAFYKRGVACFFVMLCLFLSAVLRLFVVSTGKEYALAQKTQSNFRITVSSIRGTVYDCNMVALTNNKKELYAVIPPTPQAIMSVPSFLHGEEKETVLKTLKENKPAVCRPKGKITDKSIKTTYVYSTDEDNFIAAHIIGYTDSSLHGVCGIQSAYDDILYNEDGVSAVYEANGKGDILMGAGVRFDNDLSKVADGVVLTLDSRIQRIAEQETSDLTKGAVIVCDTKSGKLRAVVSRPDFSVSNIESALNDENAPLINRAFTPFSVGSVFKPCVAAAAIENGLGGFKYTCVGKTHIIDRDFSCHKKDGHGAVDLKNALAFSCNTFFYNLSINLGAKEIYKKAEMLNFGNRFKIAQNMYVEGGNLTTEKEIVNEAMLANFGIGQGSLLLSPVSMLTLYMSIANKGCYRLPSIVEKTIKNGKTEKYKISPETRAMKETTADTLKSYLKEVVLNGTGKAADVKGVQIAGKTATAQTGRYDKSGKEITNSWFCGIFSVKSDEYAVVVMSEGESQVSVSAIFSKIAEKIAGLT